jgi:hypothetical protein
MLMFALGTVGLTACGGDEDEEAAGGGATAPTGIVEDESVAAFCEEAWEAEAEGSLVFELHIFGPEADMVDAVSNLEDLEDAAGEPLKSELTVIREWMQETLELTTEEFQEREQAEGYEEEAARVRQASANVKGFLIDECGFEDNG